MTVEINIDVKSICKIRDIVGWVLISASHSWDFGRLGRLQVYPWKIIIRLNIVIVFQVLHSNVADRNPFSIGEDRLRWLA